MVPGQIRDQNSVSACAIARLSAAGQPCTVHTLPPESVPNRLYKFRSLTSADDLKFTKDIVVGNRLYFASAATFNDPFDSVPNVTLAGSGTKIREAYKRSIEVALVGSPRAEKRRALAAILKVPLDDIQEKLRNSGSLRSRQIGICSLSERWDHVLMWSHYAANHTGVCLGFSTSPDSHLTFAQRVTYSDERPVVDWTSPEKDEALFRALLTKAQFWDYEKEWRLFDPARGSGAWPFPSEKLEVVIFGANVEPERKRLVQTWLNEKRDPVQLVQARISTERFELDFVQI